MEFSCLFFLFESMKVGKNKDKDEKEIFKQKIPQSK